MSRFAENMHLSQNHIAQWCRALAYSVVCAMAGSAMAEVTYSFENDGRTYVAEVNSSDPAISDEAIAVLNANEVTNFVVRGSGRLVVDKISTFTGDVYVTTPVRLSAEKSLGVGPGKIYVMESYIVMSGGTVEKEVSYYCGSSWGEGTRLGVWGGYGASTFKEKITSFDGSLSIYPWTNSRVVFEGGFDLASTGDIKVREMSGGTIIFTNAPLVSASSWPIKFVNGSSAPASGFAVHLVFSVAGNNLAILGHPNYKFTYSELKTTVDWAFDNSNMRVCFANDSRFDLCGTSQRIGYLDFTCASGNPSVVTNSLEEPAVLYVTQTADATPAAIFGGNLSVDFSGNKITTINYLNTAKGGITVNAGTLAFSEYGSWENATNVTVNGSAKITIANANALGRKAEVNLAANSSLEIVSGLMVNVRTLTVGGVQMSRGDYVFGGGTLRVSHPCGFLFSVR
jgi:hypothetical protein